MTNACRFQQELVHFARKNQEKSVCERTSFSEKSSYLQGRLEYDENGHSLSVPLLDCAGAGCVAAPGRRVAGGAREDEADELCRRN